jgi:hypothetical protein
METSNFTSATAKIFEELIKHSWNIKKRSSSVK